MKDKKKLKMLAIIVPVLLMGIIGYLFYSFQKKKAKIEVLKNLPTFSVKDIKGNIIDNTSISNGNKVLVYFDPECEFCHAEMEALAKINNNHKDVNWIMFSTSSIQNIRQFAEKYNLATAENIKWCEDPKAEVYSKFAMKGIPYFLGYNSENKLVHRSTGAINIEKVLADFDEK